jgi:tetraacyldisaccharide 4'-kinase
MSSFFINNVLLSPYHAVLSMRHFMYDKGLFKSYSFDLPVIAVGNVSAGGTGKTPHTEYLVRRLSQERRVAVVSRGYGRKSRGQRFVGLSDTALEVGDEPLQIKKKFPFVTVVVDADRVRAMNTLCDLPEDERPHVVVMDDALQHRRVSPGKSILLIDYSNPPFEDNLLPFGTLRDLPSRISSADVVVVTKCPPEISPDMALWWRSRLSLEKRQKLLFTGLVYMDPLPVFGEGDKRYVYSNYASMITGIANPTSLDYHLSSSYKMVRRVRFKDHHRFTGGDASLINKIAARSPEAVIFTTEKDAQRLSLLQSLSGEVRKRLFYLPVEVSVLYGDDCHLV